MKIIGIIPARMESSRFPGKPLARILGIPMIGHVYKRATMSKILMKYMLLHAIMKLLTMFNQ